MANSHRSRARFTNAPHTVQSAGRSSRDRGTEARHLRRMQCLHGALLAFSAPLASLQLRGARGGAISASALNDDWTEARWRRRSRCARWQHTAPRWRPRWSGCASKSPARRRRWRRLRARNPCRCRMIGRRRWRWRRDERRGRSRPSRRRWRPRLHEPRLAAAGGAGRASGGDAGRQGRRQNAAQGARGREEVEGLPLRRRRASSTSS